MNVFPLHALSPETQFEDSRIRSAASSWYEFMYMCVICFQYSFPLSVHSNLYILLMKL